MLRSLVVGFAPVGWRFGRLLTCRKDNELDPQRYYRHNPVHSRNSLDKTLCLINDANHNHGDVVVGFFSGGERVELCSYIRKGSG